MSSRTAKWLIVMMSLVTATIANAAPTIDNSDPKPALRSVSPASNLVVRASTELSRMSLSNPTGSPSIDEVGLFSSTGNSALADIGAELLKPPADFTSPLSLPPGTRPLPAVPAAFFMCLTGFLCVTLVRDRKVWLAAFVGLLWVGQAGLNTLPQICRVCFAHHLNKRWAVPTLPYLGERSSRPRSNVDDTEYIGLLRYLEGIPAYKRNTILDSGFSMLVLRRASCVVRDAFPRLQALNSHIFQPTQHKVRNTQYAIRNTNIAPQFAINTVYPYFVPALNCLAFEFRQFFCFSPAFIFENLPRGPPISL